MGKCLWCTMEYYSATKRHKTAICRDVEGPRDCPKTEVSQEREEQIYVLTQGSPTPGHRLVCGLLNWATQQEVVVGEQVKLRLYLQPLPIACIITWAHFSYQISGSIRFSQGGNPTVNCTSRDHKGSTLLVRIIPEQHPPHPRKQPSAKPVPGAKQVEDHCINAYTSNLGKWYRWTYLQSRNRDSRCRTNIMDTKEEGEVGVD